MDTDNEELKSADGLDKSSETSKSTDSPDKSSGMSKYLDNLMKSIESGKIKVISQDSDFIELTKLADQYKAELETYKDTSKQEIKNLENEIENLNQKIQEKTEIDDNGKLIDSYV